MQGPMIHFSNIFSNIERQRWRRLCAVRELPCVTVGLADLLATIMMSARSTLRGQMRWPNIGHPDAARTRRLFLAALFAFVIASPRSLLADPAPLSRQPAEPGSRVGTPRYVGVGEPYVPPAVQVHLAGLPEKPVDGETVELSKLRWAVSVWRPDTTRYDDLAKQVAAPKERTGPGAIAFDVPSGRYQIRIQAYDPNAHAWQPLTSYPDVLGHYCINCFDHPAAEYRLITGSFEVNFSGYPFVDVSLESVPVGATIEDISVITR
jgi:hypothetical protein